MQKILHKKIIQIRKLSGLSQKSLAKEMGLSVRFMNARERAEKPIPRWLSYALVGFYTIWIEKNKDSEK